MIICPINQIKALFMINKPKYPPQDYKVNNNSIIIKKIRKSIC